LQHFEPGRRSAFLRRLLRTSIVGLYFVLVACGGGGGGGASSSPGTFTLAANSAAFSATRNGALPAAREIAISVTGDKVAFVGAAYLQGQTPAPWLDIQMSGSGRSYRLVLRVLTTSLAAGEYSTTFAVGTADADGDVLRQQNVSVTYVVSAGVALQASPSAASFVFGDTQTGQDIVLAVEAPGQQWSLSSTAPWLQVPTTPQTGTASVTASIDASALAPGSYVATVRATNAADASNVSSADITVVVTAPTFIVAEDDVLLGGADGRSDVLERTLHFNLTTGAGVHPYAVQLHTDDGGTWLTADGTSGTVGNAGATVTVKASRSSLDGGTRTGEVRITATVKGMTFSEVRPVTFNTEASRLVTTASGVGLSRVPGRDVLSRRVKVLSNQGRTDVPWTASSNQPWLNVTGAGTTGGDVVLVADPTGLQVDTTHYADVTITSADARVENTQTIRVGLHLASTPPATVVVDADTAFLASNPVDALVAASDGQTGAVRLYDFHSGQLERAWPALVARAGAMTWSGDGRTLYVHDRTNLKVVAVSLATGTIVATYDASGLSPTDAGGLALAYLRPAGFPMLATPGSRLIDLTTGQPLPAEGFYVAGAAVSLAVSPDQSLVVPDFGTTQKLERTALNGGGLVVTNGAGFTTAQGRAGEACVSAAGDRIYTASGYPYEFPATSIATGSIVQRLPGSNYPNSVQCVWNGLVVGGIDGFYAPTDIWVYDGPSGVLLAQLSSNASTMAYRSLVDRGLAVSADGTRLLSAARDGSAATSKLLFQDLPPP
jgi:hypothetical protein